MPTNKFINFGNEDIAKLHTEQSIDQNKNYYEQALQLMFKNIHL